MSYLSFMTKWFRGSSKKNESVESSGSSQIPSTVSMFVEQFIDDVGVAECKRAVTTYGKKFDMSNFHSSVGRHVRNGFSLWTEESGPLKEDLWNQIGFLTRTKYNAHWKQWGDGEMYQGANMHADDASHELLVIVWREMVKRYGR